MGKAGTTAKKPGKKNKGGRPVKEIDYAQLQELCRLQCTGEECACVLGMRYETLNARLKADGHGGFLEYNKSNLGYGKASLRRLQWKAANSGNTSMLIWLGKQYLGQSDKMETEAKNLNVNFIAPSQYKSPEEWEAEQQKPGK
jgi:hypothetical protein